MKNIDTKNTDEELQDSALEWLIELQSPDISSEREKAFFEWLNEDPSHQKAYIVAEQAWYRGGSLSLIEDKSESAFTKKTASKKNIFSWLIPVGISAATCCFLIFFINLNYLMRKNPSFDQQFRTAIGEIRTIDLAEGSSVTLNTETDLSVDLKSGVERNVQLSKGEAFFNVSSDPDRPFIVYTEAGLVVVIGTKFSVFKQGGKTLVTVVEGKVGLLKEELEWFGQEPEVVLSDNQQLALEEVNMTEPEKINAERALAWRDKQLFFDGESLGIVVEELNRYFPKKISLASADIGSQLVVAVIPLNKDFDTTLSYLENSLRLKAVPSSDGRGVVLQSNNN